MHSLKCAFLVFLALLVRTQAVEITFTWDRNPEEELVAEYELYELPIVAFPPTLPALLAATPPAAPGERNTITVDVVPGIHVFYVTALNVWGESLPSNLVQTPAAVPTAPTGLRIALILQADGSARVSINGAPWTTTHVEASSDLTSWERIHTRVNVMGELAFVDPEARGAAQRFYRAVATAL